MANIYISYQQNDAKIAKELSSKLKLRGHLLSLEPESLLPGTDLNNILIDNIKISECFIALITENALNSKNVLNEIVTAKAFNNIYHKMLIIPIILGDIGYPNIVNDIISLMVDINSINYIDDIVDYIDSALIKFQSKKAAEEKQQEEIITKIKQDSSEYIQDAMNHLDIKEIRNRRIAYLCYILGFISIIFALIISGSNLLLFSQDVINQELNFLITHIIRFIVLIGLIIACSKYTFTLGKAFMNESLKNADRIHAIRFGKFYLKAFGNKATWNELKEVFQYWNIDNNSYFSKIDSSQYDPKFLETIKDLSKIFVKFKGK